MTLVQHLSDVTRFANNLLLFYLSLSGLYSTPSINDKIYLHYKGFKRIENLDEYTGLKAIWLEGNGFTKIEGLEHQRLLRSLFLHENIIEKIENLDNQLELDAINLSKNYIKTIENLSHMKVLTNLNLANNHLTTAADIAHVLEIPSLQTLDIQHNKIDDVGIVDIVAQMPDLKVLYLMGNPVVKSIKHYRKTLVGRCKSLKYLDDRPVFDEERRRVDAWYEHPIKTHYQHPINTSYKPTLLLIHSRISVYDQNGNVDAANEAERLELKKIRAEKDAAEERNFRLFEDLLREGQEIRRQRELALAAAGGAGATAGTAVDGGTTASPSSSPVVEVNPFSGESIVPVPESDEVREAREQRWGEGSVPFHQQMQNKAAAAADTAMDTAAPSTTTAQEQLLSTPSSLPSAAKASAPAVADVAAKWVKLQIDEVDDENDVEGANESAAEVKDSPPSPAAAAPSKGRFATLLQESAAVVALETKVIKQSSSLAELD